MRKLFHLEIKSEGRHKYYGSLSALCSENELGVSKFTLDRFDFDANQFENETCIIRKSHLVISKRGRKKREKHNR
jgi:hypothetical protein